MPAVLAAVAGSVPNGDLAALLADGGIPHHGGVVVADSSSQWIQGRPESAVSSVFIEGGESRLRTRSRPVSHRRAAGGRESTPGRGRSLSGTVPGAVGQRLLAGIPVVQGARLHVREAGL